ncbi:MAG: hypothetical protein E7302_12940 [Butyrivibrio sp.]|nr:hypothetical protein [Butyrivibrio sp.]
MNTKSTSIISNQTSYYDLPLIRYIAINIAVLFIGLSVIQLIAANDFKDYDTAPAYIDNVTSESRYTRKGVRTEYTFDVHWTYEGENHITTKKSSIDPPDYDLAEVRVDPETKKMTLGSSEGSLEGALLTLGITGISLLIWLVLFIFSKNKKAEVNENCTIAIGIGIVGLPIALLCTYGTFSNSKYSSSTLPIVMLDICFGLSLILGIIIKKMIKGNTKRNTNKYRRRRR